MASMLRASVLNISVFATAEAIAWRIRSSRTRVVYVACADGFGLLPAPRSSPMIGSASHRSPGLVRIHTGSCAWTLAISHGVPALTGAVREAKHCSSPRSDNRNAMWQAPLACTTLLALWWWVRILEDEAASGAIASVRGRQLRWLSVHFYITEQVP